MEKNINNSEFMEQVITFRGVTMSRREARIILKDEARALHMAILAEKARSLEKDRERMRREGMSESDITLELNREESGYCVGHGYIVPSRLRRENRPSYEAMHMTFMH